MKINVTQFEAIEKIKESVRQALGIPGNLNIEFGLDGLHAVNELSRSIADMHPHKRSIAVLGAQPPPIQEVAKNFAKQGYSVQEISFEFGDEAKMKSALVAKIDTLKKDTLFVLTSDVEPITGLVYPTDLVQEILAQKSIYLLWYQSQASLQNGLKLPQNPLQAGIADAFYERQGLSLIVKGERVTGEKLLWGDLRLSEEAIQTLTAEIKRLKDEPSEKKEVENFEKNLQQKLKDSVKLLPKECPRIFDRAVFFTKGVNGDAMAHMLVQAGLEASTSDSCYWQDPHLNQWLPKLGFTQEDSQSCTVLAAKNLRDSQTISKVSDVILKLQKISGTK